VSAAMRGSESYGRESKKEREGVKNVVTHKKIGTCRFENYEREGQKKRAKRRKKDI